jgi:transcriptional regulator with PAS, ATPase and Fis domain
MYEKTERNAEIHLIGDSLALRRVLETADAVAANNCTVLLEGETGTGKELIARYIHEKSRRAGKPFIPVNCPAVTDTLFESQFFGHVKGSFTGAQGDTLGMVRAAEEGTLFLDEIGELSHHLQSKLLRLLQEREVTPVGSPHVIKVDVRFIAATNRSLEQAIAEGKFRADLFHRLNIARIQVPPLRLRSEDIEPLLDFYLEYFANQYETEPRDLDYPTREALRDYNWPGNVRELCCWVERLYAADMPAVAPTTENEASCTVSAPCSLADMEARAIEAALAATGNNRSEAARMLDIHRTTLLRKIKQYNIG